MIKDVILCKDCRHRPYRDPPDSDAPYDIYPPRNEGGYEDDTCPYIIGDSWYNTMPEDDWFCSKGEK